MLGILLFFTGYVTAFVAPESIAELTAILFQNKLTARLGRRKEGKGRKIKLSRAAYGELLLLIADTDIALVNVKHRGLPHIFRLYGKRYGLYFGAVLSAVLLLISDGYVWRIEVSGNESVPDERIKNELSALGFDLGTRIRDVDFDVLHNRFSAASEDIAWISVNMHGSVAYVEVTEYKPSELEIGSGAANVVASRDGVITLVSVEDGKSAVSIGQSVKKGQLLISGVMEFEEQPTRYVYAKGEAMAQTEREIYVRVPLAREVKTEKSVKTSLRGIKIFSCTIFFGSKGRIDTPVCDTITVYEDVTVFGGAVLPIALVTETKREYESVAESLAPERAAALAYAEYKKAFIEKTDGVTLLSYETESGLSADGSAYIIRCILNVIENIAETKEFTVNE